MASSDQVVRAEEAKLLPMDLSWVEAALGKELTIMADATTDLLNERAKTHGSFETHARVTQTLKAYMATEQVYDRMNPRQCEALDMILHKIGRIAAGNPNFNDHWDDIAGYAKLGSEACE